MNYSIIYTILALIGGAFYREFTKFNAYFAWTTLSVVHTHYLILGMMFFLILGLVEMNIHFVNEKVKKYLILYHAGLNITTIMLVVRGIVQVKQMDIGSAVISGMAGIGHIVLGIALILILIQIKQACKDPCFFLQSHIIYKIHLI